MSAEVTDDNQVKEGAPMDADTPPNPAEKTPQSHADELGSIALLGIPGDADSAPEGQPGPDSGDESAPRRSKWPSRIRDEVDRLIAERDAAVAEAVEARAAAEDLLDRERRRLIDSTLKANGYSPRLFEAAGLTVADVLDADGLLDADRLNTAVADAAKELGVAPRSRRPLPVPVAGGRPNREGSSAKQQFAAAFGL